LKESNQIYNFDDCADADKLLRNIMKYHNIDDKFDLLELIDKINDSL